MGDTLREKPPPGEKYLEYRMKHFSIQAAPGFGHQLCNILCLIEEAKILGRIPILPLMLLPALHNKGISGLTRYRKYLSFDELQSQMELLFQEEVRSMQFDTAYHCELATTTEDLLPRDEQLVIREFENWDFFDAADRFPFSLGAKDGTSRRWLNSFAYARIQPSRRVSALADKLCPKLGPDYIGLHVRRGDRAVNAAWNQATSPEHIEQRLKKWVPPGKLIYILSDEADRDFFAPLSVHYEIRTSFDFPDLRVLVDEENDNFMLFAVESEIMRRSSFCISTEYYKGPVLTAYSLLGPGDLPAPVYHN